MRQWSGTGEAYRRSFALACGGAVKPLLDATSTGDVSSPTTGPAREHDGLRHLDVGCGDGRLASAALVQGRVVTACDADAEMCAITRATVTGLPTVEAALPRLPYAEDSFDVMTANFVINHVDDPQACAREMVRVCAPGGVVAATIWPAGGAGFGGLLGPVFSHPGVVPLDYQGLPAHLDFERTPEGFGSLMASAGLVDVLADEVTWDWQVSPDDLWAGIAAGIATPGMTYLAQVASVRREMEVEYFTRAGALSTDGLLTFRARGVLAVGTKTI